MKRIATRLSDTDVAAVAAWLAQQEAPKDRVARAVQSRAHAVRVREPAMSACRALVLAPRWSASSIRRGGGVRVSCVRCCSRHAAEGDRPRRTPTTQVIDKGEYLARAGDCVACHTAARTASEFAGGRPMPTPFGTLYVPNITPDDETGIGTWTRRRVLSNDAHRRLARRHAAVSGDAVRLVHQGDARRLRRHLRLPDVGAAGAARRTGRTS